MKKTIQELFLFFFSTPIKKNHYYSSHLQKWRIKALKGYTTTRNIDPVGVALFCSFSSRLRTWIKARKPLRKRFKKKKKKIFNFPLKRKM